MNTEDGADDIGPWQRDRPVIGTSLFGTIDIATEPEQRFE